MTVLTVLAVLIVPTIALLLVLDIAGAIADDGAWVTAVPAPPVFDRSAEWEAWRWCAARYSRA